MFYESALAPIPIPSFLAHDAPGFDPTFLVDLREFISTRLDRIDPYRESKEYGRQREEAALLYERVKAMLSEEGRKLLTSYDDALAAAHYLETAVMAEKAFWDGMRMVLAGMRDLA